VRPLIPCLLALVLCAPAAHAQWLKLGFAAQMTSSTQPLVVDGPIPLSSQFASVGGQLTFDTDAPPLSVDATAAVFAVGDHELAVTTMVNAVAQVRTLTPANSTARLVYEAPADTVTFEVVATQGPAFSFTLHLVDPSGAFSLGMPTLPPGGFTAQGNILALMNTRGFTFQAIWLRPNNVFSSGAVQYIVGGTPPPPVRACSPADLAPPLGVLNFFDLVEYLDLLQQGCP
jgi:hypothetical protein|tara:strand:- start:9203 stop:9892 length:690 start_codon:yes stop_codon:yes gene_type:complete